MVDAVIRSGCQFRYGKIRQHWKPVLDTWGNIVLKYTDKFDEKDFLCWYNERASLSTLAGAFWLNDNLALEEFSSEKSNYDRGKWRGRTDLWVSCGYSTYCIEAKQLFVSGTVRANKVIPHINVALEIAKNDAKASKESHDKGVGIVFAAVHIPKKQLNNRDEISQQFLQRLKSDGHYDFMAYAFPESKSIISKNRNYLGCVLAGSVIRKW